jgi:sugar lactone lactonase YvrE
VVRRILYIADAGNQRIRSVNLQTNIITTAVFTDSRGTGLSGPNAVAVDASGNIYISDRGSATIRKFDRATGLLTTVAGSLNRYGSEGDGGPATEASLLDPFGIALDSAGNLYIADINSFVVRKVDARTQVVTTFAGNRQPAILEDNGPATAATLTLPTTVVLDSAGNLYINDSGNERIRKVDAATGIITTEVGGGDSLSGLGDDGPAAKARLSIPSGRIAIDRNGTFYIADRYHYRIRKVDGSSHIISTIAGNGRDESSGDGGLALNAGVLPDDLALDRRGNLYFAENATRTIRKINLASGVVTTVAGNGKGGVVLGNALRISIDLQDNLLVVDIENKVIWRIDAVTGSASKVPGAGSQYVEPVSVDVDSSGNLLIVDYDYPYGVKRISPSGAVTRIAGRDSPQELGDNGPAVDAFLYYPHDAITDAAGNVYIADTDNHRIRAVRGPIP